MFIRFLLTSLLGVSAQAQTQTQTPTPICTREYAPVCGQLGQEIKTFPTRCVMLSQGGTWISNGACPQAPAPKSTKPAE